MRATFFRGPNDIRVEQVERPRPGLVIGHEPVGVVEELGPGVTGYKSGDRVLVGPSPRAVSATPACPGTCPSAGRPGSYVYG